MRTFSQKTLIFSLLLSLLHFLATAADISLGSIITPLNSSSAWNSPNDTFSLSFVASQTSPNLYYPAISYSSLPIWTPLGPPLIDSGGSLRLLQSGNLVLLNSSGNTLWETATSSLGVTSASLLDTGNFVLKNSSSFLWQSFEHPTDTILEGQNFTLNQALTSNSYSFSLVSSGNLTLKFNNSIEYFNNGYNATYTQNRTITSPVLTLQTNGLVQIYDGSHNATVAIAYSDDYGETGDMIRFLRLDNDGNFRAYSAQRGSSATAQWSAVTEQCDVFGYCGNFGVCTYNDTSPYCICPSKNFEFIDPSNPRNGCKRTQDLSECPSTSTMFPLENTQFLTYPPEVSSEQYFVGLTACRQNCLSGSSCVASTALGDGSGLCFLKVTSFVSAYQSATLPSTSYVKVCPPAVPNPPPSGLTGPTGGSSRVRYWVIIVVVVGTIFGLVAVESGLWWCFCRNSPKYGGSASGQYALIEYASGAPVQFSYKELNRTTKGFKERLGSGGFGTVYRGLVNRIPVAVKRLEGIEQGEKQFRMEVATISSTHHLNLVRLIGFCSEGRHRLLVYEFMKNGSLDAYLFGDGKPLPWPTRFNIAIGTARGVTYLHEECRDCIVHCDIKPENILIDESFNAKVSDFGLAKLINAKDHRNRTLTSVRGTRGYLAPEWLANLPITSKSDVYSYGMVLLELISGRRNFDVSEETGRKKFSVWAYEEFVRGDFVKVLDQRVVCEDLDMEQIGRALKVCFWCIQEQPSMRPTMGKVVQMLEGIMEVEQAPPPRVPLETSQNVTGGGDEEVSGSFLVFAAPGEPADLSPESVLVVKDDESEHSS